MVLSLETSKDKMQDSNKNEKANSSQNEEVDDIVAKIIMEDPDSLSKKEGKSENSEAAPLKSGENEPIPEKTETVEVDPEFLNDFLVETREHIENIEMCVLALETDPGNLELINSLFRSFHTVKGLAGFVNQDLVRTIAHQTETELDKCRKGE